MVIEATGVIEAQGEMVQVEVPETGTEISIEADLLAVAAETVTETGTAAVTETAMTEGQATGRSPVADMVVAEIEIEIEIVIVTEGKAGHAGTASSLSY